MTPRNRIRDALRTLGLSDGATQAQIRYAYATAVMADHPDKGGSGDKLHALIAARDVLIAQDQPANDRPCKLCGGSGRLRKLFGALTCAACHGSGESK